MAIRHKLFGIYSPVLTAFHADLFPDMQAFVLHCQWLVANDCGLAMFGTNSEANSLSAAERCGLLDALLAAGVPSARLLRGTGCCSLTDTVELTRHAATAGLGGVLMLRLFYYKSVSDEGPFRHFAEVKERVGDSRLRIYPHHILPVAEVPISLALIERLLKAYPTAIAGIKDSSGDWSNTEAMPKQFQPKGFDVCAGSEVFLLRMLRRAGAGCITATGNVNPAPMVNLFQSWQEPEADAQQTALNVARAAFQKYPLISAMKSAAAHYGKWPSWRAVRPPLTELTQQQERSLVDALDTIGLRMPGL